MVLLACLVLSQAMVVSAEKKKTPKYKVTLNKTVYTMKKGKSVKLKATLNKAAKGKKIVWSTSNANVATVKSNGKVTAKKNGKATITAKIKGTKVKATCKIVVGTPLEFVLTIFAILYLLNIHNTLRLIHSLSEHHNRFRKS